MGAVAGGVVARYIAALQTNDSKTLIDLSYGYQNQLDQIKAQNPQVLWPKLTKEYYDSKISSLTSQAGVISGLLQGLSGDPAQQIHSLQSLLLPDTKWKVSETRSDHVQDSIQYGGYDRTIVYVTIDYPSLNDSPFVDGKFLKETMLEFDLSTKSQLVMTVNHLAQGDTPWDAPLMIMNTLWSREALAGHGTLRAEAVGGKPPFTWTPRCGSFNLSHKVDDPDVRHLVIDLSDLPTRAISSLHCTIAVADSSGQSDAVGMTVPQMFSGWNAYCFVRPPWLSRGQARPGPPATCIEPVITTEAANSNISAEEPSTSVASGGEMPSTGVSSNPSSSCGDFSGCMRSAMTAYKSRDWGTASTDLKEAASQNPSSGEPWVWLGRIVLTDGQPHRQSDLSDAWDKALSLESRIMIGACHELTLRPCERGDLVLSINSIAFMVHGNDAEISVPPGDVEPGKVFNNAGAAHVTYSFKAEGKNFVVDFFPPGIQCNVNLMVQCPPAGISKQLLLAQYVSESLPKLASGSLVSTPNHSVQANPAPIVQPAAMGNTVPRGVNAQGGDTIIIDTDSGPVRVNNFHKRSIGTDEFGGEIFEKTSKHIIDYNANMPCFEDSKTKECFGIDLSSTNDSSDELPSQHILMNVLGVTLVDFCRLPVAVVYLEDRITGSKVATKPRACSNGK
jgi:hypothetical protein